MRAFEFLTEYGHGVKGLRSIKYRDGGKPDWYEKAAQLKTNNPRMAANKIGKQVGARHHTVIYWLAGTPDSNGNIYNDNPPFTQKDFPRGKYSDGAKPWWYEEAVAMRKQGMPYSAIVNKLSTPEKKISINSIASWLVKGRKHSKTGKIINPDAPFEPIPKAKPINTDLIKELILDPDLSDADIIELIADEKGDKIASQVRAMLPKLRQKLNPGTQVIDKTRTGNQKDPDITGFVQETMHVTYSGEDDLTLTYNINETSIAQRWATLLDEAIQQYTIDDPKRLYGFDTLDIERQKAVDAINKCVDTINEYSPGFVERRMTPELIQDDLNYLHHSIRSIKLRSA